MKPLLPTFLPPTAKQKKQRAYWQALGTVIGFHGYLQNLQRSLKHTDICYKDFLEIAALHEALRVYEDHIRYQLDAMTRRSNKNQVPF